MFACIRASLAVLALFAICQAGHAANHTIDVGGSSNVFTPKTLTINSGDTVTFTNVAPFGFHNVVSDDGTTFNSGNPSSAAWTYTTPPLTASTGFFCSIHGSPGVGMHGTITVNAVTPSINLGGYLSGNWFMPSLGGGNGFQIEFTNSIGSAAWLKQLLAIWFVYTPAGSTANDGSGQNWIYAQGDYDPTTSSATVPAVLFAGARFPPNFNASDIHWVPADGTFWGHITFTFSDCNNGTVSWHSDLTGYNQENDTPLAIQRLTQIDGTTCPQ